MPGCHVCNTPARGVQEDDDVVVTITKEERCQQICRGYVELVKCQFLRCRELSAPAEWNRCRVAGMAKISTLPGTHMVGMAWAPTTKKNMKSSKPGGAIHITMLVPGRVKSSTFDRSLFLHGHMDLPTLPTWFACWRTR